MPKAPNMSKPLLYDIKKNSKVAKKIAKKGPISKSDRIAYNNRLADASEGRMQARVHTDIMKGRDWQGKKPKMIVTSDNRPEVVKGSKASGVTVNSKMVRQGKVKAAENMVRKAKIKMAAKAIGRIATPVAAAIGAVDLIKAGSKLDPKSPKIKGKTGRNKKR